MKLGDLVRRVPMGTDPQEAADYAELGVGVLVGFEDAPAPLSPVLNLEALVFSADVIVMWPKHGIGWEFPERLEVVNETR